VTNAPISRKTHVTRLAGTNRDGDVVQDIWVDLERMDVLKPATQMLANDWQGSQRQLRWADDPNADDYDPNGNPARTIDIVKVCSPDEVNVDDPEEWVEVQVIRQSKSSGGEQKYQDRFVNDETVQSRIAEVRKIPHYDTNIDDAAQAAFDADPTLTAYVVQGVDYVRDDSTKDDTQFVDHEIIEYYKPRTSENNLVEGDVDRGVQVKLLNQYLIDESDDPDGTVVGGAGINPPYRLDPYQNIINVNLGALAVEFFDRSL
jgi:hypothetical protein